MGRKTHDVLNCDFRKQRFPSFQTPEEEVIKGKLVTILNGWDMRHLGLQAGPIHTTLLPIKTVGVQGDAR